MWKVFLRRGQLYFDLIHFRKHWIPIWNTYPLLHPDLACLEASVRNWDFSEGGMSRPAGTWAGLPPFLMQSRFWSAEELLEMDTMELLGRSARSGNRK